MLMCVCEWMAAASNQSSMRLLVKGRSFELQNVDFVAVLIVYVLLYYIKY